MRCIMTLLIYVTLCPGARSQESLFHFSPHFAYDTQKTLGFDAGFGYGFSASIALTPVFRFSPGVTYSSVSSAYGTYTGTKTVTAHTVTAEANLLFDVLGASPSTTVAVLAGGGIVKSTIPGQTISAGPLGAISIPERSDTRGFFRTGFSVSFPITHRFSMFAEPTLRLIAPVGSSRADYSMTGGLSVAIL
jgi:hypothetical protein